MTVHVIRLYSKSAGTVQLANMAFRTRYGAEEELKKSGYTDVGQNRWESDKMIASITEVKVL